MGELVPAGGEISGGEFSGCGGGTSPSSRDEAESPSYSYYLSPVTSVRVKPKLESGSGYSSLSLGSSGLASSVLPSPT